MIQAQRRVGKSSDIYELTREFIALERMLSDGQTLTRFERYFSRFFFRVMWKTNNW